MNLLATTRLRSLHNFNRRYSVAAPIETGEGGAPDSSTCSPEARARVGGARRRLRTLHLGLLLIAAACAAPTEVSEPAPVLPELAPVSLEGWPAETFDLPPGFAPGLPVGTESLLFAPGWRDPSTEDFWSYAIVMRIDEAAPDAARIAELLEIYYEGLMAAFAHGRDLSSDPLRVEVVQTSPGHFEAELHLIDAFATFEPIDLHLLIETSGRVEATTESDARTLLAIQISPQPEGHPIWRSLQAAIASLLAS